MDTNSENAATQRLFPKLGYRFAGEIKLAFRPGLRFFCYEKRLGWAAPGGLLPERPNTPYFVAMTDWVRLGGVVLLLGAGMRYSARAGKLTPAATWMGGGLGLLIYLGSGFTGLALLALFFGLGTAASSWRVADKRRLGLAEENRGRRTAGQVVANAGVAGLLGLLAWQLPLLAPLARLMLAGSFAAAAADTLASELGNVYGRLYYNILTLKPDVRGRNGVVSLEGTALGLAGSAVLAAAYCLGFGWGPAFGWLLVAGTAGNLVDSVLGATLERRGYLTNNAVNFLNTLTGALVAGGLMQWLR